MTAEEKKNGTFVLLLIHQQWSPESSDQEMVHEGSEDGSSLSAQKEWMKQSTEIKFECSNSNFNQVQELRLIISCVIISGTWLWLGCLYCNSC